MYFSKFHVCVWGGGGGGGEFVSLLLLDILK